MAEPIRIVEYDANWPVQFKREQIRLQVAFSGQVMRAVHIGSTAVPGLAAKPVIDILLGFRDPEHLESSTRILPRLGYDYLPEMEKVIAERRFFMAKRGPLGDFNLHAVVAGNRFWTERIRFREQLRCRQDLARAYCQLKHSLASRFRSDLRAYSYAKSDFVNAALRPVGPATHMNCSIVSGA